MAFKIHHFGVVVNDLETSLRQFCDILNAEPPGTGIVEHPEEGMRIALLGLQGGMLELIQPLGDAGRHSQRVRDVLEERGAGFFPLCLFTDDYDADTGRLKDIGCELDEDSITVVPGTDIRVAFTKPGDASGLLIEIVDEASVPAEML